MATSSGNEIQVWDDVDDEWRFVDDIFVRLNDQWKYVLAVKVWTQEASPDFETVKHLYHWETMFEQTQAAPVLSHGTATHSSGILNWTAAPQATHYQVIKRATGEATVTTAWQTARTYTFTGLSQNKTYTFTVVAKRPTPDGFEILSLESNPVKLATGAVAVTDRNPEWPDTRNEYVKASSSHTWDFDSKWRSAHEVVQGYNTNPAKNAYGVVAYNDVWDQMAAKYSTARANNIEVLDAKIDQVNRRTGGSATPQVSIYPTKLPSFLDANGPKPEEAGTGTSFQAPTVGNAKSTFDFADTDKLRNWAQAWMDKSSVHNAMLMYRTTDSDGSGHNGYCVFNPANEVVRDWRLLLSIRWSYISVADKPPVWS